MRLLHWLAFAAAVLGVAISAFLLSPYNAHAIETAWPVLNNSCGAVRYLGNGYTLWSQVVNLTDGNGTNLAGNNLNPIGYKSGATIALYRPFQTFDLTRFPSDTIFSDVQYCYYKSSSAGYPYPIHIMEGTQSTSSLTTADFNNFTALELGQIVTSTAHYVVCTTLTNTSTIKGGTYVRMAFRSHQDFISATPTASYNSLMYCDDSSYYYRRSYLSFKIQVPKQEVVYYKNMATSTLVYAATQGARSGTQGFYVVFGIVAAAALFGCGYYMLWSRRS